MTKECSLTGGEEGRELNSEVELVIEAGLLELMETLESDGFLALDRQGFDI